MKNRERIHKWQFCFSLMLVFLAAVTGFTQNRPQRNRGVQNQMDVLYLTQEQEAEVIRYVKEFNPDRLYDLVALKERRPLLYRRGMTKFYREMRYLKDLQRRDPEKYKQMIEEKNLEKESRLLAQQYRASGDESERARLMEELTTMLKRSFDLRQLNRQMEIDRLEQKLQELKEQNRQRIANKEAIVEKRLNEMIGEKKTLEW